MTKLFPVFILALFGFTYPQTAEKAIPTYSVNDKLIGLSNLYTGLADCSIQSVSGKVRDVEQKGDMVEVVIRIDKKTKAKAIVPIGRVAEADRRSLFRHLITKNNVIRLSGYSCNDDRPFSAFSIDRVY